MSTPRDITAARARMDLSAGLGNFAAIWGAPALAASLIGLNPDPRWIAPAAWSLAFLWMGTACLVNARRCGRLHCLFSGPILLLGAAATSLLAFAAIDLGAHGLGVVVSATLAVAALTYVLELVFGRYLPSIGTGATRKHG